MIFDEVPIKRRDWMKAHPNVAGRILSREMSERGMSISELSLLINRSEIYLYQVLNGSFRISKELSRLLSEVFGSSPEFWYRLYRISEID